jgi:hypothetical protein
MKNESKVSGSTLNMISDETNIYPAASIHTAISESRDFLSTLPIISRLFEYRITLNTRTTRNARIIRRIRKTFKPWFSIVTDGRIDTKSIIAIAVNGYWINGKTPCFPSL